MIHNNTMNQIQKKNTRKTKPQRKHVQNRKKNEPSKIDCKKSKLVFQFF